MLSLREPSSYLVKPSEWTEPVQEVEAECDNVDGDEDQHPEGPLERLEEGHQLGIAGLLKMIKIQ